MSELKRPFGAGEEDAHGTDDAASTQLSARLSALQKESPDVTQLATRRGAQVPPLQKSDEPPVLGSRRARREAAEAAAAAQVTPVEDNTQLSSRRAAPAASDDITRMSVREAEATAPATQSSSYSCESLPAAHLLGSRGGLSATLPPGAAPVAMRAREGGFGTRTPTYAPRSAASATASANPVLPPPIPQQHLTPQGREPVFTPLEAQRHKDSVRRAAVGKAIAIGVSLVVVGMAAIVGIVLLARGLL